MHPPLQSSPFRPSPRASPLCAAPADLPDVVAARRSDRAIPTGGATAPSRSVVEGLRYERAVLAHLDQVFDLALLVQPVLEYQLRGGRGWRLCVPDALVLSSPSAPITIIEVKLTHTLQMWKQARGLYAPVVSRAFPTSKGSQRGARSVKILEVCHQYDPLVRLPEPYEMVDCPLSFHTGGGPFGIYHLSAGRMGGVQ